MMFLLKYTMQGWLLKRETRLDVNAFHCALRCFAGVCLVLLWANASTAQKPSLKFGHLG
jgi:hypothetical protein